ncbi:hypothetical protein PAEPH01_0056 [Pancytospora epiphaga]|nr:hypothetical protein PAEPH01_0056 [Pancytospora epiphaga]
MLGRKIPMLYMAYNIIKVYCLPVNNNGSTSNFTNDSSTQTPRSLAYTPGPSREEESPAKLYELMIVSVDRAVKNLGNCMTTDIALEEGFKLATAIVIGEIKEELASTVRSMVEKTINEQISRDISTERLSHNFEGRLKCNLTQIYDYLKDFCSGVYEVCDANNTNIPTAKKFSSFLISKKYEEVIGRLNELSFKTDYKLREVFDMFIKDGANRYEGLHKVLLDTLRLVTSEYSGTYIMLLDNIFLLFKEFSSDYLKAEKKSKRTLIDRYSHNFEKMFSSLEAAHVMKINNKNDYVESVFDGADKVRTDLVGIFDTVETYIVGYCSDMSKRFDELAAISEENALVLNEYRLDNENTMKNTCRKYKMWKESFVNKLDSFISKRKLMVVESETLKIIKDEGTLLFSMLIEYEQSENDPEDDEEIENVWSIINETLNFINDALLKDNPFLNRH